MNPKGDQYQAYAGAKNGGSHCLYVDRMAVCARMMEQGLEALGLNEHLWQAHAQKSLTVSWIIQHTVITTLRPFDVMTYRAYLSEYEKNLPAMPTHILV